MNAPRPPNLDQGPYRIQIATPASRVIRALSEEEWAPIRRGLAEVANLAAEFEPPEQELLDAAGFSPPLFRLRFGGHLLLYEANPRARTLTVLHVIRLPGSAAGESGSGSESAA